MNKKDFNYRGLLIILIGLTLVVIYGIPYIQSKQIPSKSPPIIFPKVSTPAYFDFTEPTTTPIQKPDLLKIIQSKQPKLDPTTAKEIATAVGKYSKQYKFPPELIICIIERESSFNSRALSNPTKNSQVGCIGLMQINPLTHLKKLKKLNIKGAEIFRIDNNINIGCMILREYYDSTGTISKALAKYLGANSKSYILAILNNFTDLMIKQK